VPRAAFFGSYAGHSQPSVMHQHRQSCRSVSGQTACWNGLPLQVEDPQVIEGGRGCRPPSEHHHPPPRHHHRRMLLTRTRAHVCTTQTTKTSLKIFSGNKADGWDITRRRVLSKPSRHHPPHIPLPPTATHLRVLRRRRPRHQSSPAASRASHWSGPCHPVRWRGRSPRTPRPAPHTRTWSGPTAAGSPPRAPAASGPGVGRSPRARGGGLIAEPFGGGGAMRAG
jgi:hypothetical protein